MNCSEDFLTNFMIHIEFPKKAQNVFLRLYQRIQGGKTGSGYGIFFFNGQKVLQ